MNNQFLPSVILALAYNLMRAFVPFNARHSMGISTLPIEPTSGATEAATIKVAQAIKPTSTPGGVVADLNAVLDLSDPDVKFLVFKGLGANPRIIMLPTSVSDATALTGEGLKATVTPTETSGESVPWDVAIESGADAYAGDVEDALAATKPRKNVSSLINSVLDALLTEGNPSADGNIAITYDQSANSGNGELKIYVCDAVGTVTGKLGDVQMDDAATSPSARSLRTGA